MLSEWLFGTMSIVLLFNIIITWIMSFDVPINIETSPVLYNTI